VKGEGQANINVLSSPYWTRFLFAESSSTYWVSFLEKVEILIRGCMILPMNDKPFIEDGIIATQKSQIAFVGSRRSAPSMIADTEIDGEGKVAIPGLINCHTHLPMTLFRGIAEDMPLGAWLKEAIWPLESKLKPEDVHAGALLGCLEMIKSGTTCFADMYFHEDRVAEAVKKSGMRAVLAEGLIEVGKKTFCHELLKKSAIFADRFRDYADGRITTMFGPHSAYSCSPELLVKISEKASLLDVGVHIHLAESKDMLTKFEKRYGSSEVVFLDKIGFLNGHILAAHCINLSKKDKHILSKRSVNVAYVPVANMKLGLGSARIKDLVDLGVNVGLGTDGPADNNALDMFETMKVGALVQKLIYRNPRVFSSYEILKMATWKGAKALGLEKVIGSLEVGKKADVVLIDLSKPHLRPLHDIYASIVYSARGSDVDVVIVDGKILMENRQVKSLNEQTVIEEAENSAKDLLSR
jgi:5-methylthioadenosine/S-adenosylhomocysteine deaminase